MKKTLRMLAFAATIFVVAGCYESPDITIKKPGVYKGSPDPLRTLERSPRQQEKLLARFKLVQVDR
jgi:hypothetical protein